jgi:hypothetical protein
METQAQAQLTAMSTPETNAAPTGFRWKWLLYLGAVIVLLAAAKYFNVQELLKQALDWVGRLGPWGPAIFIAIYVAATVLLIPGSVLTLGAGAVFGLIRGTLIVSVASTLAATAAFLIGRYLARAAVARKIEGNEKVRGHRSCGGGRRLEGGIPDPAIAGVSVHAAELRLWPDPGEAASLRPRLVDWDVARDGDVCVPRFAGAGRHGRTQPELLPNGRSTAWACWPRSA